MKTLLSASLLAFMLCGPALADPAPTGREPGDSPINVRLSLHSAKRARTFNVATAVHSCADVHQKDADREDSIHLCQHEDTAKGVRLEVDWSTRDGASEYRESSTIVLARGAKAELGTDDVRLVVQLP